MKFLNVSLWHWFLYHGEFYSSVSFECFLVYSEHISLLITGSTGSVDGTDVDSLSFVIFDFLS